MESRNESVENLGLKLMLAIQAGNEEDITKLIAAGADLAFKYNEITPMDAAVNKAIQDNIWNVVTAIANSKKQDEKDTFHFCHAFKILAVSYECCNTKRNAVKALLHAGVNDIASMNELMKKAVLFQDTEMIKILIEYGADLTYQPEIGVTIIAYAADMHKWDSVIAIANAKSTDNDDSYKYKNALLCAATVSKQNVVTKLLEAGSKVDACYKDTNNQALHKAVSNDDVEMIKLLIKYGADLSAVNTDNRTPMQLAVHLHNWASVKAIAQAAKTDADDSYKYHDALMAVAGANDFETLKVLLEANAPTTGIHQGETLLHYAIKKNYIEIVPALIKNGVDLSQQNSGKQTAMDLAVSLKKWDIVNLIAENKSTDAQDSYHFGNALTEAVKVNYIDVVEKLVKAGALNTSNNNNELNCIIFTAVEKASLLVIRHLVNQGANLAALNQDNQTPIEHGVIKYKLWKLAEIVPGLRHSDESDSYHYGNILILAMKNMKNAAAISLINGKANLESLDKETGNTPLHIACELGNVEMVELLVNKGAKLDAVNSSKITPIELAAKNEKWDCVAAIAGLVKTDNADTFKFHNVVLSAVNASRPWQEIKLLIDANATQTRAAAAALLCNAMRNHRLDIAKNLILTGFAVNGKANNTTPLHEAVKIGSSEGVRFLMQYGASLSVTNGKSETALELAIRIKNWDCASLLLSYYHNSNDKMEIDSLHLEHALLMAIKAGHVGIVKSLLEKHAPFHAASNSLGNIALYWAVKNSSDDTRIVKLLLEQNVDISLKTSNGMTIEDFAKQWGYSNCLALIKLHSGNVRPNLPLTEYRKDAARLFQKMCDEAAIAPEDMPAAVRKLAMLSHVILEQDLSALKKRRDELDNDGLVKKRTDSPSLLELSDAVSDRDNLNSLIGIINTLLKHPHDQVPVVSARNEDKAEALDVQQYLERKKMMDAYIREIKQYLTRLRDDINRVTFKVYRPMRGFIDGLPTNLSKMKKHLTKLKEKNTGGEIFAIYIAIIEIMKNIKKDDDRHEDVAYFYNLQKHNGEHIKFKSTQTDAVSTPVLEPIRQASQVLQKLDFDMKISQNTVYPIIDTVSGDISYPPEPMFQSPKPMPLLMNVENLLSAQPIINVHPLSPISIFRPMTPESNTPVIEDNEINLPDLPDNLRSRETIKLDEKPIERPAMQREAMLG